MTLIVDAIIIVDNNKQLRIRFRLNEETSPLKYRLLSFSSYQQP